MTDIDDRQAQARILMLQHASKESFWLGCLNVVSHRLMPLCFASQRGYFRRMANKELALSVVMHDRVIFGRDRLKIGIE